VSLRWAPPAWVDECFADTKTHHDYRDSDRLDAALSEYRRSTAGV
jgi:hypothetical protein